MKYLAEVITRDLGKGPQECIRCKDEHGYIVGYFANVAELARRIDLSLVEIVEAAVNLG